jgi:peptide/nickel transport system ATP-binding protein
MDILRISDLRIGFTIHGLHREVVKGVELRVPPARPSPSSANPAPANR